MDTSSGAQASSEALQYMINHIYLPSKVPQKDDYKASHEKTLLDTTSHALEQFKIAAQPDQRQNIDAVKVMIDNLRSVQDDFGTTSEVELANALRDLPTKGDGIRTSFKILFTDE